MFKWLSRKFRHAQRRDISDFVLGLKGGDRDEVAVTLAVATQIRNSMPTYREALMDPSTLVARDPFIAVHMNRAVRAAQREGNHIKAAGWMVWLHTLRSVQDPTLRHLGKEMWGQLKRGIDEIAHDPAGFSQTALAVDLDLMGYDQIPLGLDPSG